MIWLLSVHGGKSSAVVSNVRINEVMASNKGAVPDENGDYPDWVELYNAGSAPADISGYGLSDDIVVLAKWTFPQGTVIPAGGYLVVYCSGDSSAGPLHANFRLNATEVLVLTNKTGRDVDSVSLTSVGQNLSCGRTEASANVWAAMSPSPGFPNTDEGVAAYRAQLSVGVENPGVYINEFMASNATTLMTASGEYADWIELYNGSGRDVDLSEYGLSDDMNRATKWTFPAGTVIPADGYLVVFCDGADGLDEAGALHATFGLRTYQEAVVLSYRGHIIDSVEYTSQETDVSMARTVDGTGEFAPASQPTPGYPNTPEGAAAFAKTSAFGRGDVVISEVLAANVSRYQSENGEYDDWIEIYNQSSESVSLLGYALSDNPNNPAKWVFPDVTIKPNEYLLVLASGNDVKDTQKKNLETNFALNAEGEVLLLFSPEGIAIDKLTLGKARADISYGRSTSGQLLYYDKPTPGAANAETGYEGVASMPQFVTVPGIYDETVTVELTAAAGEEIRYTLDCTTPTSASALYTGPFEVSKNTVVRAIAVKDGYLPGYTASGTYLFTGDGVDHAVDVVSLVTDPKNLWDEKTGIYVKGANFDPDDQWPYPSANYAKKGDQWEREANFSLFEDGRQVFAQTVSARIAGAYGRGREQKGFNLIARSIYGNSRMDYAFFDNRDYTSYKAVVLRAGGQDQSWSKIRDELSLGLLEGTDVQILHQAYRPVVLYLNGEYWGVYFLKEKRNRFFVAQHENTTDADHLNLIKSVNQVNYGSSAEWKELMQYISTHSLSNQSNYDYVCERMDVNSFMDYMICEIYVANSDYWNIQYYKLDGGKWKWVYYDFCNGWHNYEHETLYQRRQSTRPCSDIFNALLENAGWKDAFCRRMAELMKTVYAPERVDAYIDMLFAYVEPEIAREREKFNGADADPQNVASYNGFLNNVKRIREFAQKRPAEIRRQFKAQLGLSDAYMKEVFGA